MRKTVEPGLAYAKELRINPARNFRGFIDQLVKVGGKTNAEAVMRYMENRSKLEAKGETPDFMELYKLKNITPEFSLAFSGALEGTYIRNICNWIADNKELFSGDIIDVGCDCGVFTCYLAKVFPEAKVVGVDHCDQSIESAKALATKLGITNVSFICGDAAEVEEKFGTVFSSQVAHETFGYFTVGVDVPLNDYADVCKNQTLRYANTLAKLAGDSAKVISIERFGNNPLLLGWIRAISEAGLRLDTKNFMTFSFAELDNPVQFVMTVSEKGEPYSNEMLDKFYAVAFMDEPEWKMNPVTGWFASLKLHLMKGELLDGYYGYNIYGKKVIKVSLWTNKLDDKSILCEAMVANENRYDVSDITIEAKEKCLETLAKDRENFRAMNYTIKDFKIVDGKEVEM